MIKQFMQTVLFDAYEVALKDYVVFLLSFILRDKEVRDTEIIEVLLIEHDLWLIEWREILVDSLWDLVTLDVGWKRSQGGVSPDSGLGLMFGHILLLLVLQVLEVSICLSELWINCLL